MSFANILGQKDALRLLQEELEGERIHHAYLFLGKDGVGKKTLAFEFVKAIFCMNEKIDACGECLSCRKINHGNHPDIKFLKSEDSGKIKIDQIRDMQKDIAYKPYEGKKKVYILEDADNMTDQAANSLLKTLEEPPEYALIILLAEEIDSLLPTVISRCQQIQLKKLPKELIESQLQAILDDPNSSQLLANFADGSLGQALNLAEDEDFFVNRRLVLESIENIAELDAVQIFAQAELWLKILKENDKFPLFDLLLSWYRDIILYNQGYNKAIVNIDYLDMIKKEKEIYSIEKLISIIELINTIYGYISKNVRKDLALEVLLFKLRAKKVE